MYELCVKTHFSAAHRLPDYDGSCANTHGHNWEVEVCVRGPRLDAQGMLIDFKRLRQLLIETLQAFDHTDLNILPEFARTPPTSEHVARSIFEKLDPLISRRQCRVQRVTVWEAPGSAASYLPNEALCQP